MPGLLVAFAGLPGSGKSTIARHVAARREALWLRIDSIEQGIRTASGAPADLADLGYRAGYAVATDNLRLGREVIADCVNDWNAARDGWSAAASAAAAKIVWFEIVCSDPVEHRRRVETRSINAPGLPRPSWADVVNREYHQWTSDRHVVDTAKQGIETSVEAVLARLLGS